MRAWDIIDSPIPVGSEPEIELQGLHPHKPLCVTPESPGSRHWKTKHTTGSKKPPNATGAHGFTL